MNSPLKSVDPAQPRVVDLSDTSPEDYIPGGVHSSIRRFDPILNLSRAEGSRVYDMEGKEYLDYHLAFGPILLGHRDEGVTAAVNEALGEIDLVGSGATRFEVELSRLLVEHVPSAERVLLTNSGSEATYHAIRVSRAMTGRDGILKFRGSYHGWHDSVALSVQPIANQSQRDLISAGMLGTTADRTMTAIFNDFESVEDIFREHGSTIAAVIVEPIQHGIGCITPQASFLEDLRRITSDYGALLIFDEVITGFRHAIGGFQSLVGVMPDLTTLGKAMGNGFPISAVAGGKEVMERFDTHPSGDVFFAGTFNGHPVSSAAAIATIRRLENPATYDKLYYLGDRMRAGLRTIGERLPFPTSVAGYGSIYILYFSETPPTRSTDLVSHDGPLFMRYRRAMIERGIFEPVMDLKRCHISLAHTEDDVDRTLNVAEDALKYVATHHLE
jgi:glutamate-1-semialdehyde 2,1-aminomutase